jgi:predicted nucleic acid-binding protein
VIRTFLDSGVLIAAFRSRNTVSTPALTLLDDPERVFVTTDYVRLEVLPKPLYFRRETEAEFYEAFFAAAEFVEVSQALVSAAFEEARQAGLAAMDALHVAAAKRASVDEFITVERPTRPVFRVAGLTVRTLESVG